jgi:hypothetical protein
MITITPSFRMGDTDEAVPIGFSHDWKEIKVCLAQVCLPTPNLCRGFNLLIDRCILFHKLFCLYLPKVPSRGIEDQRS